MPRRPIGDTPMTPAERKRRQRTNGRATTERVNAAIITAFKRGLDDLVEHARPATLLTVYHEVIIPQPPSRVLTRWEAKSYRQSQILAARARSSSVR